MITRCPRADGNTGGSGVPLPAGNRASVFQCKDELVVVGNGHVVQLANWRTEPGGGERDGHQDAIAEGISGP